MTLNEQSQYAYMGWSAVVAVGLWATGCSLLLDFSELEARAECVPCRTVDACTPSACTDNGCLPKPEDNPMCSRDATPVQAIDERCSKVSQLDDSGSNSVRLLAGPRLEDLSAETIGKTQVLVAQDYVYHVAYVEEGGKPDVVLRAFALAQQKKDANHPLAPVHTLRVADLLPENEANVRVVRSPGSIAINPKGRVVLYVAHGTASTPTAALSRLELPPDLSVPSKLLPLIDPENYRVSATPDRLGPQAGYLQSGEPFVAWQGCNSNDPAIRKNDVCATVVDTDEGSAIYTYTGDITLDAKHLLDRGVPAPLAISALQTLSGGVYPAAIWGTQEADNIGLVAGVPDARHSLPLLQCNNVDKHVLTSLHAAPSYQGNSSIVWSKRSLGSASAITEAASVTCGEHKCVDLVSTAEDALEQCSTALYQERVFEDIRAASHGVWMPDEKDLETAIVVSAKVTELGDGRTRLTVTQSQGSPDPNVSSFLSSQPDEVQLAEGDPNWPELHVQARRHQQPGSTHSVVGVGWVQNDDNRAVAKLQIYDLCVAR